MSDYDGLSRRRPQGSLITAIVTRCLIAFAHQINNQSHSDNDNE